MKVCDIAVPEQVEQCFREIEQEAGSVDVLVNNAAYHKSVPVVETSNEEWLSQISINLNGTFFCTKAVLPAMIRNRYGKIINISSSAAKHFFPGFGAYAASKERNRKLHPYAVRGSQAIRNQCECHIPGNDQYGAYKRTDGQRPGSDH